MIPEAALLLRTSWSTVSPSTALRIVVDRYNLDSGQTTDVLMATFSNLKTSHVQAVWDWAHMREPQRHGGLTDRELDIQLLGLEVAHEA